MRWESLDGEVVKGPLSEIRVLDFSRVLAGPYASMLLGDLGADVIKVEPPAGDPTRNWGPPFLGSTAVYYLAANRNKRSVVLDLDKDADRLAAHSLVAQADVVMENFRPGSASRFGLTRKDVQVLNDQCVHCSITSFGSNSDRKNSPAYDLTIQALGGIMGITGEPDAPPVKVGVATVDLSTALYGVVGILGALFQRQRTRKGQHIEVALLDCQVAGLANQAMNWLAAGLNPPRLGSDHPNVAPYGAFKTQTNYIAIAVGTDEQFASLSLALGHPEWTQNDHFLNNECRIGHRKELRELLATILETKPTDEWVRVLEDHDVPCAPVRDIRGVFEDQGVLERMVTTVPHPDLGELPQVLTPIRFNGQTLKVRRPPPDLGAHTQEVLTTAKRLRTVDSWDQFKEADAQVHQGEISAHEDG